MEHSLLDYYKAIENASERMLEAARSENWEQIVHLEGTCAVLIAQLRHKSRTLDLEPGERKSVHLSLDQRALSFFDDAHHAWVAEAGEFEVLAGLSSADAGLLAIRRYSPSTRPARVAVKTASPSAVLRTASRSSCFVADFST